MLENGKVKTFSADTLMSMYASLLNETSKPRFRRGTSRTPQAAAATPGSKRRQRRGWGSPPGTPPSRPRSASSAASAPAAAGSGGGDEVSGSALARRLGITTVITDVDTKGCVIKLHNPTTGPRRFTFPSGGVFDGDASQQEVFRRFAMPFLHTAFQGVNACLMCYGQTGSGKTHSMLGSIESLEAYIVNLGYAGPGSLLPPLEDCGLIPRALYTLLRWREFYKDIQKLSINLQMIEIYNEEKTVLVGHGVPSLQLGLRYILEGHKARTTRATRMNHQSSRSHCITTFKLTQTNVATGAKMESTLYLTDLAGSERMGKAHGDAPIRLSGKESKDVLKDMRAADKATAAFGGKKHFHHQSRFKEMVGINSSLSVLGRVVVALSTGQSHVPIGESVLTQTLEPALGGNCRTGLLVTISQHPADGAESASSLRFGESMGLIRTRATADVQSLESRQRSMRYYQVMTQFTEEQYNMMRQERIAQVEARWEEERRAGRRPLGVDPQRDKRAFVAAAIKQGAVPPHLEDRALAATVSEAHGSHLVRARLNVWEKLAFEREKYMAGLRGAAGSVLAETLLRQRCDITREEILMIRSHTFKQAMLAKPRGAPKVPAARPAPVRPAGKPRREETAFAAAAAAEPPPVALPATPSARGGHPTVKPSRRDGWRKRMLDQVLARDEKPAHAGVRAAAGAGDGQVQFAPAPGTPSTLKATRTPKRPDSPAAHLHGVGRKLTQDAAAAVLLCEEGAQRSLLRAVSDLSEALATAIRRSKTAPRARVRPLTGSERDRAAFIEVAAGVLAEVVQAAASEGLQQNVLELVDRPHLSVACAEHFVAEACVLRYNARARPKITMKGMVSLRRLWKRLRHFIDNEGRSERGNGTQVDLGHKRYDAWIASRAHADSMPLPDARRALTAAVEAMDDMTHRSASADSQVSGDSEDSWDTGPAAPHGGSAEEYKETCGPWPQQPTLEELAAESDGYADGGY